MKQIIYAHRATSGIYNPIHLKINWGDIGRTEYYDKGGECPRSPFASGAHRTGWVPIISLLDNRAAGDIARRICMDCGKPFRDTCFRLKDQPSVAKWKEVKR